MNPIITDNLDAVQQLCERFAIQRLELFGSATDGRFADDSDLDFIVDLGEYDAHVADRFLDLASALESLFGRHVDLITPASIRNPYFRAAVDASRTTVYESRSRKTAA